MDQPPMTFEQFRKAFHYGRYADMQFKFLAKLGDDRAAEALSQVLARLGEAFDTGDFTPVREAVYRAQLAAYSGDDTPEVDDAPFTAMTNRLAETRLALVSAGGVFRIGDDPMGQDGPSQHESLALIKDFLRGSPTLSLIPKETPNSALTARHPGYDALTPQRDPGTVFPLDVLRELEAENRIRLTDQHYAFVGATSQVRLRERVAPQWVQQLAAEGVEACLLVAT